MRVLRDVDLDNVVFIDTETATILDKLEEGTPTYEAWVYQMKRELERTGEDVNDNFRRQGALYAEFSRFVCITVGRIKDGVLELTTYADSDEKKMLSMFMRDLDHVYRRNKRTMLCGHNVKGFDVPFLFKRALSNQVPLCDLLDVAGLKPWEVNMLDTKELWRGTDYKNTSLVALCLALGVDSPKGDIIGAEVGDVFRNEGAEGLKRISRYCEGDVKAVANCVKVIRYEEQITDFFIKDPKDRKPEGTLERIARKGTVSDKDEEDILEKAKSMSYQEKELLIKNVKASLSLTKNNISEDLEIKILKA